MIDDLTPEYLIARLQFALERAEKAEARIKELEDERDHYANKWNEACNAQSDMYARIEELEAKLKTATEGLEDLAKDPCRSSFVIGAGWAFYNDTIIYARAVLAKMENTDD